MLKNQSDKTGSSDFGLNNRKRLNVATVATFKPQNVATLNLQLSSQFP